MSIPTVRNYFLTTFTTAVENSGITAIIAEGQNFTPKTNDFPFARFQVSPREVSQLDGMVLGGPSNKEAGLCRFDLWFARNLNSIDTQLALAETVKSAFQPKVINSGTQQLIIEMCWSETVTFYDNAVGLPIFVRWSNFKH